MACLNFCSTIRAALNNPSGPTVDNLCSSRHLLILSKLPCGPPPPSPAHYNTLTLPLRLRISCSLKFNIWCYKEMLDNLCWAHLHKCFIGFGFLFQTRLLKQATKQISSIYWIIFSSEINLEKQHHKFCSTTQDRAVQCHLTHHNCTINHIL